MRCSLRNYSTRTIHTYGVLLSKVEYFFDIPLDKISTQQFKDYVHHRITTEGISTSMVNQYISAFKILQVDVLKRDWEQIKVKRPRREKKLPVVLSLSEVERLITVTRNIKHKALLMLAYSSGLRRQELQLIKPSAIDSARMQVHVVQGKGRKDRYTILSSKTLDLLRMYYKYGNLNVFFLKHREKRDHFYPIQPLTVLLKRMQQKQALKNRSPFTPSGTVLPPICWRRESIYA